jgi:hypothetical protein
VNIVGRHGRCDAIDVRGEHFPPENGWSSRKSTYRIGRAGCLDVVCGSGGQGKSRDSHLKALRLTRIVLIRGRHLGSIGIKKNQWCSFDGRKRVVTHEPPDRGCEQQRQAASGLRRMPPI